MSNTVWLNMQETARMLNINNLGRNSLIALLRDRGILNSVNMPATHFIQEGYFSWRCKNYKGHYGRPKTAIVPLASMQGIELIRDIINNNYE